MLNAVTRMPGTTVIQPINAANLNRPISASTWREKMKRNTSVISDQKLGRLTSGHVTMRHTSPLCTSSLDK
jgi:hypothetical protein